VGIEILGRRTPLRYHIRIDTYRAILLKGSVGGSMREDIISKDYNGGINAIVEGSRFKESHVLKILS
jgi:hypothetical protein